MRGRYAEGFVVLALGLAACGSTGESDLTSVAGFCDTVRAQDLEPSLSSLQLDDFDRQAEMLGALAELAYPKQLEPVASRIVDNSDAYLQALGRTDFADYERDEQERDFELTRGMSSDVETLHTFIVERC